MGFRMPPLPYWFRSCPSLGGLGKWHETNEYSARNGHWRIQPLTVQVASLTRSALESAEAIVAAGAQNALVTLGVHGAVLMGVDGRVRLHGARTIGPYPVGSGDALLAGFAVNHLRGGSVLESVRYGGAVATANALRPGAGEVSMDDADQLLAEVMAELIT